ncbi:MAG: alpha/beta hydrolase [Actinomycetota bacterium]
MPLIDVNGIELFYKREGSGEPLVMIPGMSANHLDWPDSYTGLLKDHFDLVTFDGRGCGDSGVCTEPFTIAELADDVAGLISALGLGSAHIMGISMGAQVALELAVSHPDLVRTLTAGGASPGVDRIPANQATIDMLARGLGVGVAGDRRGGLEILHEVNSSVEFARDIEARDRIVDGRLSRPAPSVDVMTWSMGACITHDILDRLHEVSAPTLLIYGSEDRLVPVANAKLIHDRIAGSRVELIEGAGHVYFLQFPELSAQMIIDFVQSVAS